MIWAGMVYFMFAVLWPFGSGQWKMLAAICFSFSVECSQLITADWLEAIRNLPGMRLVLGYGFKFSDLICYITGVGMAFLLDQHFILRKSQVRAMKY
ncbi:DUF2809 domain-containing protein [Persicobacter sp. CCB-QB2]|uniref:ribosomal maturation YjgA family protein n=1 Tax=Persicobacter sp. CCB-QB2 TaxID=1561025 RepID=UPI0034609BF2